MKHLRGPYANVLCLSDFPTNLTCWDKGSYPTQKETCPECWNTKSILENIFFNQERLHERSN